MRVFAIPRPTYDLDFTLSISRDDLPYLYEALESEGFSVEEPFRSGWCDTVSGMPVVKLKLYVKTRVLDIDAFLAESRFQRSVIARKQRVTIHGIPCDVATAEDLVLLKLGANRPRDLLDVNDILFTQGQLDVTYMRKWAMEMHLLEPLNAALKRHGQS